jgi:hypothetical protein
MDDAGGVSETDTGDLSEVVLSLGYGPVSLTIFDNIAGGTDYFYYNLAASAGDFTFALGMHDAGGDETPTHLDISYAYSDNLSFTFSKFVADEPTVMDYVLDEMVDSDDVKFVVSYSLPLGE